MLDQVRQTFYQLWNQCKPSAWTQNHLELQPQHLPLPKKNILQFFHFILVTVSFIVISTTQRLNTHVFISKPTHPPSSATLVASLKLLQWLSVSTEASSSLKGCTALCCPPGTPAKWTKFPQRLKKIKKNQSTWVGEGKKKLWPHDQ